MACEGPSLTKSDPWGQESVTDPDDCSVSDLRPGLSLWCTSAVSLQRAATTEIKQPSLLVDISNQEQQSATGCNSVKIYSGYIVYRKSFCMRFHYI